MNATRAMPQSEASYTEDQKLTDLTESYIYGDYVSGRIWALKSADTTNPVNIELLKTDLKITSFGIDEKNELYICAEDGKIYVIELQR